MRKLTRDQLIYILYALLALLGLAAVFFLGKHCGSTLVIEEPSTIVDTSKVNTQMQAQEQQAAQEAAKEIQALEKQHAEVIKDFSAKQREEYEQVKKEGPSSVAKWLSDFNRDLKGQP